MKRNSNAACLFYYLWGKIQWAILFLQPFLFRPNLLPYLYNHLLQRFLAFFTGFSIYVMCFALAVGIGGCISPLIQVIFDLIDHAGAGLSYLASVGLKFGDFWVGKLSCGSNASRRPIPRSILVAACSCILSVLWL